MDSLPSFKRSEFFIGPFNYPHFKLCVKVIDRENNTWRLVEVPHIVAVPVSGKENLYNLILDGRLAYGPWDEQTILSMLPIIADSMAVAAGFCHAGSDKPITSHNIQVFLIDNIHRDLPPAPTTQPGPFGES